ncbi:hypothetical protein JCM11491_006178 [Sporobolomyces phaffii]
MPSVGECHNILKKRLSFYINLAHAQADNDHRGEDAELMQQWGENYLRPELKSLFLTSPSGVRYIDPDYSASRWLAKIGITSPTNSHSASGTATPSMYAAGSHSLSHDHRIGYRQAAMRGITTYGVARDGGLLANLGRD